MIRPLRSHDFPAPVFQENGDGILTVAEAAHELRCSKAHVHNVIHGKVPGLPPLPVLRIGRRVLIRHEALKAWMLSLEAREVEAQMITGVFTPGKPGA